MTREAAASRWRIQQSTNTPGLEFRARLPGGVEGLAAIQNRKTAYGFAFSVLLNEDGAGRLELTKA